MALALTGQSWRAVGHGGGEAESKRDKLQVEPCCHFPAPRLHFLDPLCWIRALAPSREQFFFSGEAKPAPLGVAGRTDRPGLELREGFPTHALCQARFFESGLARKFLLIPSDFPRSPRLGQGRPWPGLAPVLPLAASEQREQSERIQILARLGCLVLLLLLRLPVLSRTTCRFSAGSFIQTRASMSLPQTPLVYTHGLHSLQLWYDIELAFFPPQNRTSNLIEPNIVDRPGNIKATGRKAPDRRGFRLGAPVNHSLSMSPNCPRAWRPNSCAKTPAGGTSIQFRHPPSAIFGTLPSHPSFSVAVIAD
ncbi:hypothetical protein GGTG_03832 [Gaeumannomyces tritici R3-111a-1]|uniref:Uncharacterized protein n=1 Tax=Gaeumannomyces tritici (strain R3-111a-1) TaxID=644352 RepID=J3NRC8_GAET3|nr:hypothetical protein GGTG_03832 [Gaeumannomyces tritici R3-111a-1]EJT78734.1 hypothetical protein GGTG_03832 [Gaeumannomyces tritici R3-111a-1]